MNSHFGINPNDCEYLPIVFINRINYSDKESIRTLAPNFCTRRMVKEYLERF